METFLKKPPGRCPERKREQKVGERANAEKALKEKGRERKRGDLGQHP